MEVDTDARSKRTPPSGSVTGTTVGLEFREASSHAGTTEPVSGSPATGPWSIGAAYEGRRSKQRATQALPGGRASLLGVSVIGQRQERADRDTGQQRYKEPDQKEHSHYRLPSFSLNSYAIKGSIRLI